MSSPKPIAETGNKHQVPAQIASRISELAQNVSERLKIRHQRALWSAGWHAR
jgi:hypothetical protein